MKKVILGLLIASSLTYAASSSNRKAWIALIYNGTGVLTVPVNQTDQLVGRATTDTFTNKTVDGGSNTLTNLSATNVTTGTLPAAQLPNPSASTLGGIESLTAVSSNWIRSISTSGVPAASQPAFSDISGTAALTSQVTGTLPIANGGTNNGSLAVTAGGVVYTDGTKLVNVGLGVTGQILASTGSTPPNWVSASAIGGAVPAGTSITFMGSTCPTGYLTEDGSLVSRTTFAILFAAIGNTWGNGDGSTTFNLPDVRGYFERGQDIAAINDPDDTSRTAIAGGTFTVGSAATTNTNSTVTIATGELVPGMTVTGTGIPASSVVRSVTDSTHFVIGNLQNSANVNATASNTGLTLTFSRSALGNYVGSYETSKYTNHSHTATSTGQAQSSGTSGGAFADLSGVSATSFGGATNTAAGFVSTSGNGTTLLSISTTVNTSTTGSTETRPLNVYSLKCIRTGL